jgi:tetratricopeptide (TPR) repeat protein
MRLDTISTLVAVAALVLATGCSLNPAFEKEASGQPVLTWRPQAKSDATTADTTAVKEDEQALRAELRDTQQKDGGDLTTVDTLYRLAVVRRQQGDLVEAGSLYSQALEICEREKGPDDADVAAILNNLAAVEAAQGHYDAALPLLERTLTIRQKSLGENSLLTAQSMNNLALLHAARGNSVAAEPLYQQAIAILEKTDASSNGELDRVLDNYAALLRETGRDVEASKLEARARLIRASAAPAAR